MNFQIHGTTMQTLALTLDAGEVVFSQTNCMAWMSDGIQMQTHTDGGMIAGMKRVFGGGSFFITDFTASAPASIAFAPRFPGTILPFKLEAGESIICRKQTFLCAERSVELGIFWKQSIGAGFFDGEGYILQRITGPGTVWLDLSGEVVIQDLVEGQRILVQAGHIGLIQSTVKFGLERVRGFRNILFGGDGLYLATVTGPGRVWLQSMPILNLAEAISHYLPNVGTGDSKPATWAGEVIGGVIRGVMEEKKK